MVELANESGNTTIYKRMASWLVILIGKTEDFGNRDSKMGGVGVLSK